MLPENLTLQIDFTFPHISCTIEHTRSYDILVGYKFNLKLKDFYYKCVITHLDISPLSNGIQSDAKIYVYDWDNIKNSILKRSYSITESTKIVGSIQINEILQ